MPILDQIRIPDNTSPTGEIWRLVVAEFEDDSFMEGEVFNPPESAFSKDELLSNTTEEE